MEALIGGRPAAVTDPSLQGDDIEARFAALAPALRAAVEQVLAGRGPNGPDERDLAVAGIVLVDAAIALLSERYGPETGTEVARAKALAVAIAGMGHAAAARGFQG